MDVGHSQCPSPAASSAGSWRATRSAGTGACARPSIGIVLRHPNGGMVTVLANGETRGGDKAGPGLRTPRRAGGASPPTLARVVRSLSSGAIRAAARAAPPLGTGR